MYKVEKLPSGMLTACMPCTNSLEHQITFTLTSLETKLILLHIHSWNSVSFVLELGLWASCTYSTKGRYSALSQPKSNVKMSQKSGYNSFSALVS